jgi:metal-responsive CopG/Arc/MetJ family transcriptional regulator
MVEKINITIPKDIKCEVDRFVDQEEDMNRSRFFAIAAYYYLQQIRKSQLVKKLEEGYSTMADETKELSDLVRDKQIKALKYI